MSKLLLMYSNHMPSLGHIERLADIREDIKVVVADSGKKAISEAPDADIILGHRYLHQTLPYTRKLKWVQSTAGGIDHLIFSDLVRISPILTRCPIFYDVVAFHAFALALSVLRRIPEAVIAQTEGKWAKPFEMCQLPTTAMILGMGMIGKELARILRQNGIYVIGMARRKSSEISDSCDELVTGEEWRNHLGRTDLCFLALPGTREARGLFDDAAISALPAHAVIVNVGREGTIDMDALQKHLRKGHLGGAAVDVLEKIPGPDNSLWSTPRLLITPKVASFIPERNTRLEDFIESQVKRYFDDKPPLYQVDYQSMEIMQNYRK